MSVGSDFAPVLSGLALIGYLPVVYAALVAAKGGKWKNLTFIRAVAKDLLRTFPVVALVWAPVFAFPCAAKWYMLVVHLVFTPLMLLELGHIKYFGARVGINTFYSLFVTNTREVKEFVSQSIRIVDRVLLLAAYLLPIPAIVLYVPAARFEADWMRWAFAAAALLAFVPFLRNLTNLKSGRLGRLKIGYVLNPYSSLIYHWFVFKHRYGKLMRSIAEHSAPPFEGIKSSVAADTPETYVIVIGESANSMHCSYCGYPRNTNEFTDRLGDSIMRIRGVHSPFAQTLPVLEKVLTFADRAHPDLLWTKGSVIDYFKDAGFKTFWLTNQYALDDTAITAMAGHADVCKCFNFGSMKRFEKAGLDGDMISELEKVLSDSATKKVVFLHLIGSHAAYVSRYPGEFVNYSGPVPGKEFLSPVKAQMVNTYDDSIRYTDYVISEFIKTVEAKVRGGVSFLLYLADHGEDIFDTTSDKILGHSQLANEPMTSVPFMIWTNRAYDALRPDVRTRVPNPDYNSENVIHTIIDLASLTNPDFEKAKSILQ